MKKKVIICFLFFVVTIALTTLFFYGLYIYYGIFCDIYNSAIGKPLSVLSIKGQEIEAYSFVQFSLKYKFLILVTLPFAALVNIKLEIFELDNL